MSEFCTCKYASECLDMWLSVTNDLLSLHANVNACSVCSGYISKEDETE